MKALLISIPLFAAAGSLGLLFGARVAAPPASQSPLTSQEFCLHCHEAPRRSDDAPVDRRLFRPRAARIAPAEPGAAPDIVLIDQLAELYRPVVFDHRVHAVMSEIEGGCANCHHFEPKDGAVQPCRACHPIERHGGTFDQPSLKGAYHRQCLSCHRDWSHANGCGYCHEEQAAPAARSVPAHPLDTGSLTLPPQARTAPHPTYVYETRHTSAPIVSFNHLDHARAFDLQCVDCHKGGSCAGCHDGTLKPREPVHSMPACRTCHAANECRFCHDQSPRPAFDHLARTGWDPGPRHAGVSCVQCHGRVESFVSPSRNCRACHGGLSAATFDHGITGVPLAGSHAQFKCTRCHDESRSAAAARCDGCHATYSYPAQWPGRQRLGPAS